MPRDSDVKRDDFVFPLYIGPLGCAHQFGALFPRENSTVVFTILLTVRLQLEIGVLLRHLTRYCCEGDGCAGKLRRHFSTASLAWFLVRLQRADCLEFGRRDRCFGWCRTFADSFANRRIGRNAGAYPRKGN